MCPYEMLVLTELRDMALEVHICNYPFLFDGKVKATLYLEKGSVAPNASSCDAGAQIHLDFPSFC